jgi:hypothetical protein
VLLKHDSNHCVAVQLKRGNISHLQDKKRQIAQPSIIDHNRLRNGIFDNKRVAVL